MPDDAALTPEDSPIGCETCVVTVERDGRLIHEERCTIRMYREALAEEQDRSAALTRERDALREVATAAERVVLEAEERCVCPAGQLSHAFERRSPFSVLEDAFDALDGAARGGEAVLGGQPPEAGLPLDRHPRSWDEVMPDPLTALAERLQKQYPTAWQAREDFWRSVAREALAFAREQTLSPDFVQALRMATARFTDHPHWKRLDGTPWQNDAPVIAADLMCALLRELRQRLGGNA